ncbi:MAG: hypothetical protein GY810_18885 [Aureispira sp.]|nr:hypothetical protein [Aureispira sp.]
MEQPRIVIERISQYANSLRKINIYINEEKVDPINDGERKVYGALPGENEIYAKIDWCQTKPLSFFLNEGEEMHLELGSNLGGWKLFYSLYYMIFDTKNYLYLKEEGNSNEEGLEKHLIEP